MAKSQKEQAYQSLEFLALLYRRLRNVYNEYLILIFFHNLIYFAQYSGKKT